MSALPSDATAASRKRYEVARDIIASCPPELGREIALTGSAARGIADDFSEVEINVWVDLPVASSAWRGWLETAGATDIGESFLDESDGGTWTTCSFGGVWLEIGWIDIAVFDRMLHLLLAGEYIGHDKLCLGWIVSHAVPLRTDGLLARWQEEVKRYPASLPARIIADQTSVWSDPHVYGVRLGLAARGQRFGLAMRLQWDIQNILRVLWAINHRWDQDWKWTDERSLDMPIKPIRLSSRIDEIFTMHDPHASVLAAFRLIEETLALVPTEYDVSMPLANYRTALRELERR